MIPLPSQSPFTGGEIVVTRFYCPESDTSVEGQFTVSSPFAQLSTEQIAFVELFVRSEGRISRMEGKLGLSYPTIRSRLREIVEALGYEANGEDLDDGDFDSGDFNGADGAGNGVSPQRAAVENVDVENAEVGRASKTRRKNSRGRAQAISTQERQRIIKELDEGKIDFDDAMKQLEQS